MTRDSQGLVFDFLSSAETHGVGPVARVDTHISAVFLAGDRAYKVKRAVRLPFLDFSTLEARRRACEAEVRVNRRFAPHLYVGTCAVTREDGGRLAMAGKGEPVEWMVVMRRFNADDQFDRMAAAGRLDRDLMRALAAVVAEAHDAAPARPDKGGEAAMRWTIDNNAECFGPHVPDVFHAAEIERLTQGSHAALDKVVPLLEERRRDGRVRHCHGDLHLANICLLDGRPTPFDAIEFSEDIACVDVHYDLTFLLMDLDRFGLRAHANAVLNGYAEETGDDGALAALPLFLSCRAAIRAHIAATIAARSPDDGRRRAESRTFLRLALGYLDPPPPRLVAVGGLSGSGKSRLGREVAPSLGAAPGAVVLRTDVLRKRLMGARPLERLGPEGYSAEMTEKTYRSLYDAAARALAAGHSVVADAVFAKPEQRDAIERVAREAGVPFDGFWLEAPPDVMRRRVEKRTANASDATVEVLMRQLDYDLGEIRWRRIDSSGEKEATVAAALRVLGADLPFPMTPQGS